MKGDGDSVQLVQICGRQLRTFEQRQTSNVHCLSTHLYLDCEMNSSEPGAFVRLSLTVTGSSQLGIDVSDSTQCHWLSYLRTASSELFAGFGINQVGVAVTHVIGTNTRWP
jgi:hypothetical protein